MKNKRYPFLLAALLLMEGQAMASSTTLISNNASKIAGYGYSYGATLSTGGSAVAFASNAKNFVAQDGNNSEDIYLKVGTKAKLISVNSKGEVGKFGGPDGDYKWQVNNAKANSRYPSIDAGGKLVVFQSTADNLDTISGSAADTIPANGVNGEDIFLRDIGKKKTYRLSGVMAGASDATLKDDAAWKIAAAPNDDSFDPAISNDGKVVVFESEATNLVDIASLSPATNTALIYAIDLKTKKIELISAVHDPATGAPTELPVDAAQAGTKAGAFNPSISPDGRFVTYTSKATNLDSNVSSSASTADIFVYDRIAHKTYQLSGEVAEANGAAATINSGFKVTAEGNGDSDNSSISGANKLYFIAFQSLATNLDSLVEGQISAANDDDIFVVALGPSATNPDVYEIKNPHASYYNAVSSPSPQQIHPIKRISAILNEYGDYETDPNILVFLGGAESAYDDTANSLEVVANKRPVIAAKGKDYVVAFYTNASNLLSTNDNPAVRVPTALKSHEAYWQEDSNGKANGSWYDIYVYDSKKKLFRRANVDPEGIQGSDSAITPAISPDGKAVAFETADRYLTWDIIPSYSQIFLRKE